MMWISKKKWQGLEKRVTDLENLVQGQITEKLISNLADSTARAFDSAFHTLEELPQKQLRRF